MKERHYYYSAAKKNINHSLRKFTSLVTVERFLAGIIFGVFAALPAVMVSHFKHGFTFDAHTHSETYYLYFAAPMFCAFITAFLLSPKLAGTNHGIINCAFFSILIVIVSLILWVIPAIIIVPSRHIGLAPVIAIAAGTIFWWAVYPAGIMAGFITRITIRYLRSRKNKNNFAI